MRQGIGLLFSSRSRNGETCLRLADIFIPLQLLFVLVRVKFDKSLMMKKPTLLNSNSIWKQWMKSHLVEMPLQIPIII